MTYQRTVLISGGSRGIGLQIAKRLSHRGEQVISLSRRGEELDIPRVTSMACDVTDAAEVERTVEKVVDRFGTLDLVIPNAGVGSYGRLTDVSYARVAEQLTVNILGTVNLVKASYAHLKQSSHADVVAVVSEAGRRGFPEQTAYCASKFGQLGFMRSLDHEAREDGIRVTSICPGGVATEFAMGDGRGRTPDMPELNEMLTADDVAYLVEAAVYAPRNSRVLEAVMRSTAEPSWG